MMDCCVKDEDYLVVDHLCEVRTVLKSSNAKRILDPFLLRKRSVR